MMYRWMVAVLLVFFCQEISTFRWVSDLQDGADIYACLGEGVQFPWDYSVQDGEVVQDIKWYYNSGDSSRRGIAAVVEGDFFPLRTSFSDRIHHVLQAGLALSPLTTQDSGEFSVVVTVLRGSSFASYNMSASLVVADDSLVRIPLGLWAQEEQVAVYDNKTGQMHVQVSCSGYFITGNPPLYMEWTLPSGEKLLTSNHINNSFLLNLPNPVKGGNYTCRLSPQLPPMSCLPHNATLFGSSSVSVDEVRARLTLIEVEQEVLRRERVQIDRLTEDNRKLKKMVDSLQNELENNTNSLVQLQDYFKELDSPRVIFDARPSASYYYKKGQPVRLEHVITNEGNAFNETTGEFTAPFNGTYFFMITAQVTESIRLIGAQDIAALCDNTTCFCYVRATIMNQQYSLGTCQAAVHRSQGQQAWLRSEETWYLSSVYTSFTGFSLRSDVETEL